MPLIALSPILTLTIVVAWLSWNRYLDYRETGRMLAEGEKASAHLAFKERTRIRTGLLSGLVLIGLGMSVVSWLVVAVRTGYKVNTTTLPTAVAASVFLVLVGMSAVIVHALWSRKMTEHDTERSARESERAGNSK